MKKQYNSRMELIEDFQKLIIENRSLAENCPGNLLRFRVAVLYLNTVPSLEAFNAFVNLTLDLNE